MQTKISKAVIPAAGLGTRFLPITKAVPKELLPIIDIPMIQLIFEEVVNSGIRDIVLITARNKEAIETYFDTNYELEDRLSRAKKDKQVEELRAISKLCNLITIRQKEPLGLGHAVLTAEKIIGDEPFAVLLPDDIIDGVKPCTQQLIEVFCQEKTSVVGVMEVPLSEVSKYGIVSGKLIRERLTKVESVIEKPFSHEAPSRLAIPGRYVLGPEIFSLLKEVKPGKGGEVQLTDGLLMLAQKMGLLAYQFEGERYDTGDRIGYLDATLTFALRRPELKPAVIELLKKHVSKI